MRGVLMATALLLAGGALAGCAAPKAVTGAPPSQASQLLPPPLEALRARAEAGDAEAARRLGAAYESGRGVPRDYAMARHWYGTAAALGSRQAMYQLGLMYDTGRGTRIDRRRAAEFYRAAARKGYAPAEYRLAMLYEAGEGVPRDPAAARRLYKAAAEHGSLKAQRRELAAAGKTAPATGGAADSFDEAQSALLADGMASPSPQALRRLESAARKQDGLAQYDLGYLYENGIGVPADKVQAYVWYRKAAGSPGPAAARTAAEHGASALEAQLTPAEKAEAEARLAGGSPPAAAR